MQSVTKSLLVLALLIACPTLIQAQDSDRTKDERDSTSATVAGSEQVDDKKLIYSVNRTPERPFDTSRAVVVITSADIWRKNARTLPELLMEEAGIFVQQTNYGAGSPIIRGLVGKQILILVDGVKVNTATFRLGPLQYLATIDLSMVERVEIVRGVGSVLGSDALGGVINIITKKGPPVKDGQSASNQRFGGALFSRFSSADRAITGRLEGYGQTDKLRYIGGVTYRHAGDVDGGGEIGRQIGTGYAETAGNFSLDTFLSTDRTLSIGYQVLEQNDVPRTDRIASGTNLLFYFNPQRLQLARVSYQDLSKRKWSDYLQVVGYFNRQDEGQQQIAKATPTVESFNRDSQVMMGFTFELGTFIGESQRLVYGVDYTTEHNRSYRSDVNLVTRAVSAKRGTYTDGATYKTLGLYVQDRVNLGRRLTLNPGFRFSRFSLAGSENSSVGVLNLDSTNNAFTGSVGAVFQVNSSFNLVGTITRGFRAPNVDDVSVFNVRPDGAEVPNPSLAPEHITATEVGAKYSGQKLSGSAFFHYSRLTELHVRKPGTFNGLTFIDSNGNGVKDPSEVIVLQRQNLGTAIIHGLEFDGRYRFLPDFSLYANLTRTVGDDQLANEPLARMPPTFGTVGLRWDPNSRYKPWAELVYTFADSQRRLNSTDISDIRIGRSGTDEFNVFHLRGGLSITDRVRISLAFENMLDRKYKYHGSGVYRPGSQIVIGSEFRF
ncbi:MAG TPA: TonB-dependent receptor [Blastocatellia bacterium]|nr:TonB-dependent receptor [Blastocatellia bacterium]